MEDRITALEIKIAYLEDFLNKLQAIAVEQGEIVDTLKVENRVLKSKIKEILDNQEDVKKVAELIYKSHDIF